MKRDIYAVKSVKETVGADPYVGRGIIVGATPSGRSAVAYFIMGRSENSRNRVFELKPDGLYTKPYDESKVADPRLIIYRAACEVENNVIVTCGGAITWTNAAETIEYSCAGWRLYDANDSIVVICHARPATAEAWTTYLDDIQATGIRIVPVKSLLR